jgi:hypothetical protein
MMVALVCGVGINDRSCPAKVNGKLTKEYSLWKNMLNRVYSKTRLENKPSYLGCSVSDTFLYYHLFYNWCQIQIGFNAIGYDLDKDLLIKGNKQYSEDTCVFIPKELNALLTKTTACRGLLPIGVTKHGSKFQAQCKVLGKLKYLGLFDTPELAFQAYKAAKEAYIKEQAELYKDSIDPRAYQALLNYEVSLDD